MPLEEPEGVDARRAELGMSSLADDLRLFGPEGTVRTLQEVLSEPEAVDAEGA